MFSKMRECYNSIHIAAHKAEQPIHMSYFIMVYWSSHASYGLIALGCAVCMLLAWERK